MRNSVIAVADCLEFGYFGRRSQESYSLQLLALAALGSIASAQEYKAQQPPGKAVERRDDDEGEDHAEREVQRSGFPVSGWSAMATTRVR